MLKWLKKFNIEYVEQPLSPNDDAQKHIFKNRSLPIFLDESCNSSDDIYSISNSCDGVVIKLMKCGGLTEALQILTYLL